ncbi:MAG: BspA family leucine-rich repeat surface protein [Bacillota bacterium]
MTQNEEQFTPAELEKYYIVRKEKISLNPLFQWALNRNQDYENWQYGTPLPPLPKVNTKISLGGLFIYCKTVTTLDLNHWDTSKVTDMSYMFYDCNRLTDLKISNWDTRKVRSFSAMFDWCNDLASLDISNWNTSAVEDISFMCEGCFKLTDLDIRNWQLPNLQFARGLFLDAHKKAAQLNANQIRYTERDLEKFYIIEETHDETSVAKYKIAMVPEFLHALEFTKNYEGFAYGTPLPPLPQIEETISLFAMLDNCIGVTELDLTTWNMQNVTNVSRLFDNCISLEKLDISNWDTTNFKEVAGVFNKCKSLKKIDIRDWHMENVVDAYRMFHECHSVESLDVSHWNTANLVSTDSMFAHCMKLKSVDISHWDTAKISDMSSMFANCGLLESLELTGWHVESVTKMDFAFQNCKSLQSLDLTGWNPHQLKEVDYAFSGCDLLSHIDLTHWLDIEFMNDIPPLFRELPNRSPEVVGLFEMVSTLPEEKKSDLTILWAGLGFDLPSGLKNKINWLRERGL